MQILKRLLVHLKKWELAEVVLMTELPQRCVCEVSAPEGVNKDPEYVWGWGWGAGINRFTVE